MTDGPNVDDRVDMLLTRAKSDPDAAALALQWIAMSLRKYGKLPQGLANHLADAIEASMGKPAKHRAKALTDELGLTGKNRRPAADAFTVGTHICLLMHEKGLSMSAAAGEVAHKFGISDATARKYYKTFVSGGEWEVVPSSESLAHKLAAKKVGGYLAAMACPNHQHMPYTPQPVAILGASKHEHHTTPSHNFTHPRPTESHGSQPHKNLRANGRG